MIKRCLLYKAMPHGREARTGGAAARKARRKRNPEWEPELGLVENRGSWNRIRYVKRNGKRSGKRNGIRNRKRNRKRNGIRNGKQSGKRNGIRNGKQGNKETRKRGNEEKPEAEGNTLWEGDKAPNLTNKRYSRI